MKTLINLVSALGQTRVAITALIFGGVVVSLVLWLN